MKPYILVRGSDKNIDQFEEKVSQSLEEGYEIFGDLITKTTNDELFFFQPMVLEEEIVFDEDDLEELEETLNED